MEAEEMERQLYQAFENKYIESCWECHRKADDHQANLHISKNRQWAALFFLFYFRPAMRQPFNSIENSVM